ncbi:MAG: DUF5301 domain-containing protein [Mogibacterium sp.]|nr:DUF5301 domain-containing protein [Mogibacterium sp.]
MIVETVKKRITILVLILSAAVLSFAYAGCASARDKKVDLPEADSIESIQLQFCDDSCTVSEIVDITDDNKNVITELIKSACGKWDESVNDNPQEVPYVVINIHTENQEEDRTVFVYEKNKHYYVEQPYAGVWTASEELYDMVYDYAEHANHIQFCRQCLQN